MNPELARQTEAHRERLSRFGMSAVPRVPVVRRPPLRIVPAPLPNKTTLKKAVRIPDRRVPIDADLWLYHGLAQPHQNETAPGILKKTAEEYGISVDELMSDHRRLGVVFPRMVAIHRIARAFPTWSYPRIGRAVNREHTTVMYALGQLKRKPKFLAEAMAAA